ncbi:tbp-associated factor taf, putative [Ricinus communis]|uniref:Transcription initiation factor TFIID subunit 8 n=1 Tax=Ricinus communis TaxID=3988 RepID=B9SNR2_RICCO|nr:tbp-associated factor taf, putative [Ricinus communis]|eukprot:XP_002527631.1 transcription initiation factor TFIID subunit 8 [Ricinus communis]
MSHGGGQSGRVQEKSQLAKRKSGSSGDEFARSIAKIAVAQICECTGFQTFQQSALETLSDVTVRYICNLGKLAQGNANSAGRIEGNAFDIIQALEELCSSQGFASASDVDHCIASSGIVRDIAQYVSDADDVPFAYSIPPFPIVRERKLAPIFSQIGEKPPWEHIPDWLPAFPDPQIYLQSPTVNEGATDLNMQKFEPARLHPKIDRSLLQQPFTSSGSQGPSSNVPAGGYEGKLIVEGNPFVAAPLQCGEKEVSHVVPPAKLSNETAVRNPIEHNRLADNHVSVLNTFAPAIKAMNSRLCDSEEGQKKVLLNQRPAIQFKIAIGKKSLRTSLELGSQNKSAEKISPWSEKDNENDDKKRRAEKILKQSIENPGELAQL